MTTLQSKNYIQILIKGTGLHVIGSVLAGGDGLVIFPPANGLTLTQARAYADAMVRAAKYVGKRIGKSPGRGNPGVVVENDDLHSKRLLFFNDDQNFVTWSREALDYGLYTFPVISVDGLTRDLASTMQASTSIYAAIDEAVTKQKQAGQAARHNEREARIAQHLEIVK